MTPAEKRAFLDAIFEIWCRYPDMTLGHLLDEAYIGPLRYASDPDLLAELEHWDRLPDI